MSCQETYRTHIEYTFILFAESLSTHKRRLADHGKIQHAPPKPGNQDTLDRGRIHGVFRGCHPLPNEPSRVYRQALTWHWI